MHRFESGRRLIFMKVLQKYYSIIATLSRKKWIIAVLFLCIILLNVVIFPLFISPGEPKLIDARFQYNSYDLSNYLTQLTPAQQTCSILLHLTADILYPVIYTLLLSILLYFTGGKYKKALITLPLFIFIFDILENSGIVILLTKALALKPPVRILLILAPVFTTIKWILVIITVLILAAGTIHRGILRLIKRPHSH